MNRFDNPGRRRVGILVRVELDHLTRLRLFARDIGTHRNDIVSKEFLDGIVGHLVFGSKFQICAEEALAQEYDTYGCST